MTREEYYGTFISEDSVIRLIDGTEMKGKYEVTKGILGCCETYHKEHINMRNKNIIKYGLVPAALGAIVGIGICKIIKWKNEKQIEQK